MITMPAPNRKALMQHHSALVDQLPEVFERRWSNVIAIADAEQPSLLFLGAWGCGAFRNDPKVVAAALRRVLDGTTGRLEQIIVAIPNRGATGERNHREFRQALT